MDLHVSKDSVVVVSHDPSLKRCFGIHKKVSDCDWKYLQGLRTIDEPKERMPTLVDVLEFLDREDLEHVWALLDIKVCIIISLYCCCCYYY